jgi:hypothetical protein
VILTSRPKYLDRLAIYALGVRPTTKSQNECIPHLGSMEGSI